MEQNNYQVPIKALPRNIQAIVQRHIQGSGQGVRLINHIQHDRLINHIQGARTQQQQKQRAHPYQYSVKEAIQHAHTAWTPQTKLIRQNTRFDIL